MPLYLTALARVSPFVFVCASCVAPPPLIFDPEDAAAQLEQRTSDPAVKDDALDLVDVDSAVIRAASASSGFDPSEPGYWSSQAVAFAPASRSARREWRAARAAQSSAGAPAPFILRGVDHQFGGEDTLFESVGLFDLFGHLGLGPASANRAAAAAQEALALARFESAAWQAARAAARASVDLAAVRARIAALGELTVEARGDLERIDILERSDRVGEAAADSSRAMVAAMERRLSLLADQEATAVATLARAAGIDPADPALAAPDARTLQSLVTGGTQFAGDGEATLAGRPELDPLHPDLTVARFVIALREAEVRAAAAASWPGLRLGPHLGFPTGDLTDDLRVGGLLQLELPFPSSWRGRLDASVERREGALEAYADTLLGLRSRTQEAREQLALAEERRTGVTPAVSQATASAWRSIRTSFRVGRGGLDMWVQALQMHADAITMPIDDDVVKALALLDLQWTAGLPSVPEESQP